MRIAIISNILATWVTVFAALGGGYVALDNYLEDSKKRIDDRAKQTFEMVRTFTSRDMVPLRDKVFRLVTGQRTCSNETMQQLDLSATELFTFVEFFDLVTDCTEAGLCDATLARNYFSPYANVHWPVLKPHIEAIRQGEANMKAARPYGHGLESLAENPVPVAACGQ